jgi:hypothetical protein
MKKVLEKVIGTVQGLSVLIAITVALLLATWMAANIITLT